MENKFTFPLTFTEALEVLKNNSGWVQGDDFIKSVVFINDCGIFKMRDFRMSLPQEMSISVGMMNQKYRVVHFESELN